MQIHSALLILIGLSIIGCKRLEVNVGKKSSASSPSQAGDSLEAKQNYETWNSIEDSLAHLDKLKEEGAEILVKVYSSEERQRIRTAFRLFREALNREALDANQKQSPWSKLADGACTTVKKQDLLELGEYGDLRELLGTAFLARLKIEDASTFHAQLPDQLDQVTKLAFFEFGLAIDGESTYQIIDEKTSTQTDVRWKVIHEQGEPLFWKPFDAAGVRFSFNRTQYKGGKQNFELAAMVGPKLFEEQVTMPLPAMALSYENLPANEDEDFAGQQSLALKKGRRLPDGTWSKITVSRRVVLVQNHDKGDILKLTETNNDGLPGEYTRHYSVDLSKFEICSAAIGSSDPGMPTSPPPTSPKPGDVPGQNGDNPTQNGSKG